MPGPKHWRRCGSSEHVLSQVGLPVKNSISHYPEGFVHPRWCHQNFWKIHNRQVCPLSASSPTSHIQSSWVFHLPPKGCFYGSLLHRIDSRRLIFIPSGLSAHIKQGQTPWRRRWWFMSTTCLTLRPKQKGAILPSVELTSPIRNSPRSITVCHEDPDIDFHFDWNHELLNLYMIEDVYETYISH